MSHRFVWALVAVSLAVPGCCKKLTSNDTGDAGASGETELGPLKEPRESTVKAVYFKGKPGPTCTGGTSDVTVRIQPNTSGKPSVGVLESFSGGTGNQWKTAGWIAAFNSSLLSRHDLSDHEFIVKVSGHIDGPSAGMLMTSTMLALLKGDSLRPNTTMTGTINPDGSAGPVGGVVQKMEGAKKSGIENFGYPIGIRNHKDMKTGKRSTSTPRVRASVSRKYARSVTSTTHTSS